MGKPHITNRAPCQTISLRHLLNALVIAGTILGPTVSAANNAAAANTTVVVVAVATQSNIRYDGVVEAIRQTTIAAQVTGAIVSLPVKAGDRVTAGQILMQLDARTVRQQAIASAAQVQAAQAMLVAATHDFERQQKLQQQGFISQAALDRARADFRTTQSQVNALLAQTAAAKTQTDLHTIRAPYAGLIAEVAIMPGDMALPGRPLLTIYDPSAMRVAVDMPQSALPPSGIPENIDIEIPGITAPGQAIKPSHITPLPTIDAVTHTLRLWLDLPRLQMTSQAIPGMFAKVGVHSKATAPQGTTQLRVPLQAIVRRSEMTGVYVLDSKQQPQLRQVRIGQTIGTEIEILSGLKQGERILLAPHAITPGK